MPTTNHLTGRSPPSQTPHGLVTRTRLSTPSSASTTNDITVESSFRTKNSPEKDNHTNNAINRCNAHITRRGQVAKIRGKERGSSVAGQTRDTVSEVFARWPTDVRVSTGRLRPWAASRQGVRGTCPSLPWSGSVRDRTWTRCR